MKLLALETSGTSGSVAMADGTGREQRVVVEAALPVGERTARSLLPDVRRVLAEAGWKVTQLDAIAVTIGPGSFTGLRIGVVAAKTLAYALGCQLYGVSTLEALAVGARAAAGSRPLRAILDAQRGDVFAARFAPEASLPAAIPRHELSPIDAWLMQVVAGDAVVGPPLRQLASRLPEGATALAEQYWTPRAAAVAQLAAVLAERGDATDPFTLLPTYGRASAAEEKAGLQGLSG